MHRRSCSCWPGADKVGARQAWVRADTWGRRRSEDGPAGVAAATSLPRSPARVEALLQAAGQLRGGPPASPTLARQPRPSSCRRRRPGLHLRTPAAAAADARHNRRGSLRAQPRLCPLLERQQPGAHASGDGRQPCAHSLSQLLPRGDAQGAHCVGARSRQPHRAQQGAVHQRSHAWQAGEGAVQGEGEEGHA